MKNGVKMLDIAEKLGVSVVTVSNALAGRDGVSEQMKNAYAKQQKKWAISPRIPRARGSGFRFQR